MAEFKILNFPKTEPIAFNYEELKAEITEKAKTYETLVYTEATIAEAKEDRASLNKLKKALDDERKRREKEYMQPFAEFKAQVNEIIGIIDRPVQIIDSQVKAFENAEKDKKKSEIENIWEAQEGRPDWMRLEQVWNERWLNKTYSLPNIKADLEFLTQKTNSDVTMINGLPEFNFEALEVYKQTLDITRAIAETQRLADIKKRKEEAEAKKAAEEAKKVEAPAPAPTQEPKAQAPAEEAKWIGFQARLTVPQALELREFFRSRNIEFKPII